MNVYISSELPILRERVTALLARYSNIVFSEENAFTIVTRKDDALDPYTYTLSGAADTLTVTGGSDSAQVCGAFEALRRMGLFFDVNGEWLAHPLDLHALDGQSVTVTPLVKRRAIRQHINFPMDISCYSLKDALAYIDHLAQLQYNAVTFHSYDRMWHSEPDEQGTIVPAGQYFYSTPHHLPEAWAQYCDNQHIHAIPEVEEIYFDHEKRDDYSVRWLRAVMDRCKEYGMEITLSLELHDQPHERHMQMLQNVMERYPAIDVLELFSSENETLPVDEAAAAALLADLGESMPEAPITHDTMFTLRFLRDARWLLDHKEELFAAAGRTIPLRVGVYNTNVQALTLLHPIVNRAFADVHHSYMPAHGAVAVDDNTDAMNFDAQDWATTMLYSWCEFDGNMFIQQMSTRGVERLLRRAVTAGKDIFGIGLNHWRVAENAVAIDYAARALRDGTGAKDFYREYIASLHLAQPEKALAALELLEELDVFCRDHLFNIGFCAPWCWMNPKGLTWIQYWQIPDIRRAGESFARARQLLNESLTETADPQGIQWLRLMINRLSASAIHLDVIECLAQIRDKYPDSVPEDGRAWCLPILDKAQALAVQYLDLHAACMPDRACQGTLVSYYHTIPRYIQHIRECYVCGQAPCTHHMYVMSNVEGAPPPNTNNL